MLAFGSIWEPAPDRQLPEQRGNPGLRVCDVASYENTGWLVDASESGANARGSLVN